MSDWLFDDPPNVAVFTTRHVLEGKGILLVTHDADDGSWQFHTGQATNEAEAKVVSLRRIVELDPSVTQLFDLPLGWAAIRPGVEAQWQRRKSSNGS
ncbi:MAG: hypothetical protein ACFCU8_05540 [Thermosynechococcaceae cyanobacterium]